MADPAIDRPRRGWRGIAARAAFVALGGCGGGGGSGGGGSSPAALLSGLYHQVLFQASTLDGATSIADYVQADGVAALRCASGTAYATTTNGALTAGVNSCSGFILEHAYQVDAAHTLLVPNDWYFLASEGAVSPTGDVALTGTPAGGLMLRVLLRAGSGQTAASIAGGYRGAHLQLGAGPAPRAPIGDVLTASFDGIGSATLTGTVRNADGVVGASPLAGTGACSVSADGRIGALSIFTGGMQPGGDLLVLGGGYAAGQPVRLLALVRIAAGASASTWSGVYELCAIELTLSPSPAYRMRVGTATSAGDGTCTFSARGSLNGGADAPLAEGGTYGVAPDGTLTVTRASGVGLAGAVSADGRVAVLGGATSAGHAPCLWILMRR